jgi:hypothetical protein
VSKFLKYPSLILGEKKKEKYCKDLGVGKDLTKFEKNTHA